MKMTVAAIGLKFEPIAPVNLFKTTLPESASILAVELKDNSTILITFSAPTHTLESDNPWNDYEFIICKCDFSSFDFQEHKYLGNIRLGKDSFAVFYTKKD